jgi:hypothetical protein
MMKYTVEATADKIYVHTADGCAARLCALSAEFYAGESVTTIKNCSFEIFQKEAKKRGFIIPEHARPVKLKKC